MMLATRTKLQRLCLLVFVCAGVGRVYFDSLHFSFASRFGGADMQFAPDSDPLVFVWMLCVIPVFALLMHFMPELSAQGAPGSARRIAADLIDLVFSLTAISGVGGLIPLWVDYRRMGHLFWQFSRQTSDPVADTDALLFLIAVLVLLFLMVCSVALPLTLGKQTVGGFIMRIRLTSPFAHRGRLPFGLALRRACNEILWVSRTLWRKPERIRTDAPAVLVGDD